MCDVWVLRFKGCFKQDIPECLEPRERDCLDPQHLGTAVLCVMGAMQACCLEVRGVTAAWRRHDCTQKQEICRDGRLEEGVCQLSRLDEFIVVG
jgi:hypothetical protein